MSRDAPFIVISAIIAIDMVGEELGPQNGRRSGEVSQRRRPSASCSHFSSISNDDGLNCPHRRSDRDVERASYCHLSTMHVAEGFNVP